MFTSFRLRRAQLNKIYKRLNKQAQYLIVSPSVSVSRRFPLKTVARCRKCPETQQQQLWAAERKSNGDKENTATPTDILQSLTDHHFLTTHFFPPPPLLANSYQWWSKDSWRQTNVKAQTPMMTVNGNKKGQQTGHTGWVSCPKKKHKRQLILYSRSFIWISFAWKTKRLVLVCTAGSATTSPLELPALGADVGPGRRERFI